MTYFVGLPVAVHLCYGDVRAGGRGPVCMIDCVLGETLQNLMNRMLIYINILIQIIDINYFRALQNVFAYNYDTGCQTPACGRPIKSI